MTTTRAFGDAETRERFKAAVRVGVAPGVVKRLSELVIHPIGGLRVPAQLPLPPTALPHAVCDALSEKDCEQTLGLRKMRFDDWAPVIANHACVEDAATAPLVLGVVARHHNGSGNGGADDTVLKALRMRRCIPVEPAAHPRSHTNGDSSDGDDADTTPMLRPDEAYLPSEALKLLSPLCLPGAIGLGDVPTSFLTLLGLRAQPPISLVRQRMSELNWGHRDLVGYLERREADGQLSEQDWEELRDGEGNGMDGEGHHADVSADERPTQYLPTRDLKQLGLPTIEWAADAPTAHLTESQKRILQRLGVRERPPIVYLLRMAAGDVSGTTEIQRLHALTFLCKHMVEFYSDEYNHQPEYAIVPIAGSKEGGGLARARPSECFVESTPWSSAFPVADSTLIGVDGCLALRLPQRPLIDAVVQQLITKPPSEKAADKVFEYMHRRADELSDEHWVKLSELPFVPIRLGSSGSSGTPKFAPASKLFFGSSAVRKKYGALLDYCALSSSSNGGAFLRRCGVSDTPSPVALADCIARNSARAIESLNSNISNYMYVLRELWAGLRTEDPDVQAAARVPLVAASCIIGFKHRDKKRWHAVSASECFLADNQRYVEMFEPLVAPEDEEIKALYTFLGVRAISDAVEVDARPAANSSGALSGEGVTSKASAQVDERIRERACLLLHDIDKADCPPRGNLIDGMRDLLRAHRIIVSEVPMIHCTLRFGGREMIQTDAKACVRHAPAESAAGPADSSMLHVFTVVRTDVRELLEAVGDALASAMLRPVQKTERIVFEALLASELSHLRRKGFNVDRFEDELAFARMQQHERMACMLQAGARGMLARIALRSFERERLERRQLIAATHIQSRMRCHAARTHLAALREAEGAAAAIIVQSRARQRAAVRLAERERDALAAAAVEEQAAHDELVRKWNLALATEAAVEAAAADEAMEAAKMQEMVKLKNDIAASLFTTGREPVAPPSDEPPPKIPESFDATSRPRATAPSSDIAIDFTALDAMDDASRTLAIGNALYPGVNALLNSEALTAKVTGMLLEMPYERLGELLVSTDGLTLAVSDAVNALPPHMLDSLVADEAHRVEGVPPPEDDAESVCSFGSNESDLGRLRRGAGVDDEADDEEEENLGGAEHYADEPDLVDSDEDGGGKPVRGRADSQQFFVDEQVEDGSVSLQPTMRGGKAGLTPAMVAAQGHAQQATLSADDDDNELCSQDGDDDGGANEGGGYGGADDMVRVAEERALQNDGKLSVMQQSMLWNGVPEASVSAQSYPSAPSMPAGSYADALNSSLDYAFEATATIAPSVVQPHPSAPAILSGSYADAVSSSAVQGSSELTDPDRPVVLQPVSKLNYAQMAHASYGEGAPPAVGLWQPDALLNAPLAPPVMQPAAMAMSGFPTVAPETAWLDDGSSYEIASSSMWQEPSAVEPPPARPGPPTRFDSADYYGNDGDDGNAGAREEMVAEYEARLINAQQAEADLTERALAAERALSEAQAQIGVLSARVEEQSQQLSIRQSDIPRDPRDAQRYAELKKQLSTNRQNSDTLLSALRERVGFVESDVEELFATRDDEVDEKAAARDSCHTLIEQADAASAQLDDKLALLEERRRAVTAAEDRHAAVSHQLAANALVDVAAQMRSALESRSRMAVPARLAELEAHTRGWLSFVREQAQSCGMDAGPEAAPPPPQAARAPPLVVSAKGGSRRDFPPPPSAPQEAPPAQDNVPSPSPALTAGKGRGKGGKGVESTPVPKQQNDTPRAVAPEAKGKGAGRGRGGRGEAGGGGRGGGAAAPTPPAAVTPESGEIEIILHKQSKDTRIGVTLTGERGTPKVTQIAPPPALAHGTLRVGDTILSVNEWPATGHSETTARLKRLQGRLRLRVVREG